jgi:hypothetical protein
MAGGTAGGTAGGFCPDPGDAGRFWTLSTPGVLTDNWVAAANEHLYWSGQDGGSVVLNHSLPTCSGVTTPTSASYFSQVSSLAASPDAVLAVGGMGGRRYDLNLGGSLVLPLSKTYQRIRVTPDGTRFVAVAVSTNQVDVDHFDAGAVMTHTAIDVIGTNCVLDTTSVDVVALRFGSNYGSAVLYRSNAAPPCTAGSLQVDAGVNLTFESGTTRATFWLDANPGLGQAVALAQRNNSVYAVWRDGSARVSGARFDVLNLNPLTVTQNGQVSQLTAGGGGGNVYPNRLLADARGGLTLIGHTNGSQTFGTTFPLPSPINSNHVGFVVQLAPDLGVVSSQALANPSPTTNFFALDGAYVAGQLVVMVKCGGPNTADCPTDGSGGQLLFGRAPPP